MFWGKFTGFILMFFFHPAAGIAAWAASGFPWWQSFIFVTIWTSITTALIYFGTGKIKKILSASGGNFINKIKSWRRKRSKKTDFLFLAFTSFSWAALLTNWSFFGFEWWPFSWQLTYLLSILITSFSLLLAYFFRKELGVWQADTVKKQTNWFSRQKTWIIIILAFVPTPIPGEGTATCVAAKLLGIKHGFWIIILGNVFQSFFSVVILYSSLGGLRFLF